MRTITPTRKMSRVSRAGDAVAKKRLAELLYEDGVEYSAAAKEVEKRVIELARARREEERSGENG